MPECRITPCPSPDSSSEKIAGALFREIVRTGLVTPRGVCTVTSRMLSGGADGQMSKSTLDDDAIRIGTVTPLTRTKVPEISVELPVGSGTGLPSASHLPSRLPIPPGLHAVSFDLLAALTTFVMAGVPESTSRIEFAVTECACGTQGRESDLLSALLGRIGRPLEKAGRRIENRPCGKA